MYSCYRNFVTQNGTPTHTFGALDPIHGTHDFERIRINNSFANGEIS
jgi:hypothetical protein